MTDHVKRLASSYRVRLLVGFAVVVAVFAGAWAWSLYAPLTDAVVSQQQEHLQGVAQAGALVLSQTDREVQQTVEQLVARTDLRMTVIAADGSVVADSEEDPATMENHANRPEVREALAGRVGKATRLSATQDIEQMYVAVPASYGGERVALRVSESIQRIRQLSGQARQAGLGLLVIALVLAAVFIVRVTSATAGPVERLADAACAMAEGDLSAPVADERGSLRPLAHALTELRTQMRARIGDLETEKQTLRAVIDGLDDGVLLLEGERVSLANRAAGALARPLPHGPGGRALGELDLPQSLEAAILARAASETSGSEDIGPDPYQRYFRVLGVPLGQSAAGPRTLVVISDTTDRMRLDRVRRDFVANASHELKTPTAGILLLAESADRAIEDGDPEQALAFLSQVRDQASRLRQLVLDLLDLSRLEAAPTPGAITDVRRAVDLALASHRRAAAEKGLALEVDDTALPGEDLAASADPTDVAVALDNVLANAVAYTESGTVRVVVGADDSTVRLTVTDTGVGIPAEDLDRVFERFYRVDRSRGRRSGGTGLGLSLVRNVAERSGGSVSIESVEGSGTSVTLTLNRSR